MCLRIDRRTTLESLLFDVENDPKQLHPLKNPGLEQKMRLALRKAMEDHDAPVEQYERLGLWETEGLWRKCHRPSLKLLKKNKMKNNLCDKNVRNILIFA